MGSGFEAERMGFVGGGNMATALMRGMLNAQLIPAAQVRVAEPNAARRSVWQSQHGIAGDSLNQAVVEWASVVILAVKPQYVEAALHDVDLGNRLLISVVAGVTTSQLAARQPRARIVRAMPNTPALVGAGASAIAQGPGASDDDMRLSEELFRACGSCHRVSEQQLDAVTALSGSGPAYVLLLIEALADGGVQAGLPRATALALASQTVLGTAKLQSESSEHPAVLKDRVTSPGGTTAAGLAALERAGFRGALIDAVAAAAARSQQLGKT